MDFFNVLKITDLFQNLRKKEIFEILENSEVHQYPAKSLILEKGSVDQYIKILVKGKVYLERQNGTRVELDRGAYFGELNLLNDSNVKADIYALTDVDVLLIPYVDIENCYKKDLRVYGVLMENLARVLARRLSGKGDKKENKLAA